MANRFIVYNLQITIKEKNVMKDVNVEILYS